MNPMNDLRSSSPDLLKRQMEHLDFQRDMMSRQVLLQTLSTIAIVGTFLVMMMSPRRKS